MQSRLGSFIESGTNVLIGYVIAITSQCLIFPVFDIHVPFTDQLLIGLYFTVVSVVRGYLIRRYFNNLIRRK